MRRGASIAGGDSDSVAPVWYGRRMSAVLQPMTVDEFLAWEQRQEGRYEFDGFRPVAMTGGTVGQDLRGEPGNGWRGLRRMALGPNTTDP